MCFCNFRKTCHSFQLLRKCPSIELIRLAIKSLIKIICSRRFLWIRITMAVKDDKKELRMNSVYSIALKNLEICGWKHLIQVLHSKMLSRSPLVHLLPGFGHTESLSINSIPLKTLHFMHGIALLFILKILRAMSILLLTILWCLRNCCIF